MNASDTLDNHARRIPTHHLQAYIDFVANQIIHPSFGFGSLKCVALRLNANKPSIQDSHLTRELVQEPRLKGQKTKLLCLPSILDVLSDDFLPFSSFSPVNTITTE